MTPVSGAWALTEPFLAVGVALLAGLAAGAFANVLIERLPLDGASWFGMPRCPRCGGARRVSEMVPVLNWLYSQRRCRSCRARRPLTGPLVEACNGIMWVLLVTVHGWSLVTCVAMVFVTVLLVLAVIDLQHYLLPDVLTIPGIAIGVALTWLPGWPVSLVDASLSAGIGYMLMMTLALAAERYYGEEAIGRGDWKMVAMLGAHLGATKLLGVALIANAAGAAIGLATVAAMGQAGRRKLPLGTFLGAAGIVATLI